MANAEQIARELGQGKERKSSDGGYMTRCPCHDDTNPSLSITDKQGGGVTVHCFAGCDWQSVKSAIRGRGLEPDAEPPAKPTRSKSNVEPWNRPIRARYDYIDEHGELLYRKVRFDDDATPKAFLCSPDGGGNWQWSTQKRRRILYRLPDLLASSGTVIVCEGERDADRFRAAGLTATTLRDGASSKPSESEMEPLRDRRVVVVGDNDEAGAKYTQTVARAALGVARDVRVVALPVDGDGEDACDWFDRYGGTAGQFKALCQKATTYHPEPDAPTDDVSEQPDPLGWPIPADVMARTEPPELQVDDVLPTPLRGIVKEHQELIGCDPAVIAMTAIVCTAACIHDEIQIYPRRHDQTWTESARLWAAILGDPSTKKTPGMSKGMRPVKKIDMEWSEQARKEHAQWLERMEEYKAASKEAKRKNEPTTMEPPGEEPPQYRIMLEDTTVEALAVVMRDNPRGVLVHQDELAQWFGSMDAYSKAGNGASKDRGHWLQAYNGGFRQIDRVMRGNQYVANFSASVIGGIQPGPMRKIARSLGEDGLLQRFMVVVARPCVKGKDRTANVETIRAYTSLLEQISQIQAGTPPVCMAEGAHVHREAVEDLEMRLIHAFQSPHIRAWVGKWSGLFSRLALTWHVAECAYNGVHPGNEAVSEDTGRRVRSFMVDFLLPHAIHFYTDVIDSHEHQSHAKEIAGVILSQGWQGFSKRDLQKTWHRFRTLERRDVYEAMDTLDVSGWIEPDRSDLDRVGQPKYWEVNPRVHEMYSRHAEREKERREEARQVIQDYGPG